MIVKLDNAIFEYRDEERDMLVINEQFISNVYKLSKKLVKGKIIVDGGANIGSFSVHCQLLGAKKVIAYEPEPHNWKLLQKNLKLNKCNSVDTYQMAITPESKPYHIADEFGGSGIIELGYKGPSTVISTVYGITLQKIIEIHGKIDILKLDIEKSEYPVLIQAPDETLNKINRIVMEYHEIDKHTFGILISRLTKIYEIDEMVPNGNAGLLFLSKSTKVNEFSSL